jgi:hypothetical protein
LKPSNVKDDAGKPLEYEQRTALISQRQYRRLMALTLLNTILLAGFVIGPSVGPMVKGQWQRFQKTREDRRIAAQRKADLDAALNYTAPPDQVVYEERPDEAAQLLDQPHTPYRIIRDSKPVYFPPRPWQSPVYRDASSLPGAQGNAIILFLHGRTNPAGQQRLIRVRLQGSQSFDSIAYDSNPQPTRRDFAISTRRILLASVFEDGVGRGSCTLFLGRDRPSGHAIWTLGPGGSDDWQHGQVQFETKSLYTFFPGQPDPADGSHFTIDFERDGVRATIDGWLRENDRIELIPREGAAVDRDPRGLEVIWDPTIAPTTRPSR